MPKNFIRPQFESFVVSLKNFLTKKSVSLHHYQQTKFKVIDFLNKHKKITFPAKCGTRNG